MTTTMNNNQPHTKKMPRRRRYQRAPLERNLSLLPRDVAILNAIQTHGGTLATSQISWRYWPPDIAAMLRYWQLSPGDIEQIAQRYSAKHIYEKIELLRFLKKVLRLKADSQRETSEYQRLRTWLLEINQSNPEAWATLENLLHDVSNQPANRWLLKALDQGLQVPPFVTARPVVPSDMVSSACVKRLRLLYDTGWLEQDETPTKLRHGRGQTLWYITKKARAYLAKLRGVSVKEVLWKTPGGKSHLHTAHRLAINDFRIAVTIAAERLGFVIKKWLDEDDLRSPHSKQTLHLLSDPDDPDSKTVQRRLVPDSFFWVQTDKQWFHFLEIDRATETLQYSDPSRDMQFFSLKVRKYGAYFKHWYAQTYPDAEGRGRILVVTTSHTRLVNMAEVCKKVAGQAAGRYWLTTFGAIKPQPAEPFSETVFTGKIWHRADHVEEPRALIW